MADGDDPLRPPLCRRAVCEHLFVPVRQSPDRLYSPRRTRVRADEGGRPTAVEGVAVDAIREEWLVEDRWWTSEPLRRHYVEVVLEGGRCAVVYRDLVTGGWCEQR